MIINFEFLSLHSPPFLILLQQFQIWRPRFELICVNLEDSLPRLLEKHTSEGVLLHRNLLALSPTEQAAEIRRQRSEGKISLRMAEFLENVIREENAIFLTFEY